MRRMIPIMVATIGMAALPLMAQETRVRLPGLVESAGPDPRAEVTSLQAHGTVNLKTNQVHRNLNVQALVHVPASLDAVGVCHQMLLTELTTDTGEDLLAESRQREAAAFAAHRYYGSMAQFRQEGSAAPITISASVTALPRLPQKFVLIRGKAYVMVAVRRLAREMTPLRPGGLTELTPTMAVQILRVKHEGQHVEVQFRYEAEESVPFLNPNVTPPFVDALWLIDDRGAAVASSGGPGLQRQENQEGIYRGEGRITFVLEEGRTPVSLKFDIVTAVEEREVNFEARDVEMLGGK